ncbi:MAG: helix-turn-helix transcriptional regulator [Sphingomonadales bacterium]|jgi:putative transcriptional regulator
MISRLKVLRAEHDLTQADLGAAVGVSRQAINAIETGKFEPSLGLAWRLARHFGRPIEAIFDFTDELKGD